MWRALGTSAMTSYPCDGCRRQVEDISFHHMFGHVMRYCPQCTDIWNQFKSDCEAESNRLNKQLDLWELEKRQSIPLVLTPLDLPRLRVDRNGQSIILG